jgi:aspartyl-tRNA(Asn)/glutamyl-tRNA(Gln) amidotransferase subunit C
MKLSYDQVAHIAELAKLDLDPDEITLYQEQLSAVLEHAERLQELDTQAIPPTASVLPVRNVMRADVPRPSPGRDDLLANAPQKEDGCFAVQAVLE